MDSTNAGGSDVAVACFELGSIITDVLYHAAQILEIQQQQALVICYAENNIHYTALGFVQLQQTAEQIRSHFRNGSAYGNASFAVNVPEAYRITGEFPFCFQAKLISQTLNLDVTIPVRANLCVSKGCELALKKMHILDGYGYSFKTKEEVRIR